MEVLFRKIISRGIILDFQNRHDGNFMTHQQQNEALVASWCLVSSFIFVFVVYRFHNNFIIVFIHENGTKSETISVFD